MNERTLTGFVIKRQKLKDNDLILVLFTKEAGKVSVVAKGVKKPRAKLQSHIEPLICSRYRIFGRGQLPILVGVKEVDKPQGSIDPQKSLAALLLTETLDKLTREEMPNHNLYNTYKQAVGAILNSPKTLLILNYYLFSMLQDSGLEPKIITSPELRKYYFDMEEGTLQAVHYARNGIKTSEAVVKLWRLYYQYRLDTILRLKVEDSVVLDSFDLLTSYIEYQNQSKLKSKKVLLDTLKSLHQI